MRSMLLPAPAPYFGFLSRCFLRTIFSCFAMEKLMPRSCTLILFLTFPQQQQTKNRHELFVCFFFRISRTCRIDRHQLSHKTQNISYGTQQCSCFRLAHFRQFLAQCGKVQRSPKSYLRKPINFIASIHVIDVTVCHHSSGLCCSAVDVIVTHTANTHECAQSTQYSSESLGIVIVDGDGDGGHHRSDDAGKS